METNNQFLVVDSKDLFYCANKNGVYTEFQYDLESDTLLSEADSNENLTNPFFFNGSVSHLIEGQLVGKNKIADTTISKALENKYFEKVFSSDGGKYLVGVCPDDNAIYLLSSSTMKFRKVMDLQESYNGGSISEELDILVISVGQQLFKISLPNLQYKEIAVEIDNKKMNPYIFQNKIYFSSYGFTNHYSIYSCNESSIATLEQTGPNDLRMPKTDGLGLYYVEVINSEYLLKRRDFRTGKISEITTTGVVYNYEICKDRIIFVFSDLFHPRGINVYHLTSAERKIITGAKMEVAIKKQTLISPINEPPVFVIAPFNTAEIKAVILYFHPGKVNDDVSPRWDNMLMPFPLRKYLVVVPNFPSSTGYGKAYEQMEFSDAVKYMNKIKVKIKEQYPNKPIVFYGISSGCRLMEACIEESKEDVSAAISCFGLTYKEELNSKFPIFYALSKDDPIVPYYKRYDQLEKNEKSSKDQKILTIEDESHWIQKPINFEKYYLGVFNFLDRQF